MKLTSEYIRKNSVRLILFTFVIVLSRVVIFLLHPSADSYYNYYNVSNTLIFIDCILIIIWQYGFYKRLFRINYDKYNYDPKYEYKYIGVGFLSCILAAISIIYIRYYNSMIWEPIDSITTLILISAIGFI